MFESLDSYTLMLTIALFSAVYGILLCGYAKSSSLFVGFWQIGLGFLCVSLGFSTIMLEHFITFKWSVIALGGLVINGLKLVGVGGLNFFGTSFKGFEKLSNWLVALILVTFYYFSSVQPNSHALSAILCSVYSIQCFFLAYKVNDIKAVNRSVPVNLLFYLAVLSGTIFAARAGWISSLNVSTTINLQLLIHPGSLLIFLLMVIFTSIILIWSATDVLQKKLHVQATIDPLTKILNRRALDAIAQAEIERALETNSPLSLIILDIDYFKKLNDTYGHQLGDDVLVKFARLISNSLRSYDTFARFGGEEFVILLPKTNAKSALKLSEKLRRLIGKTKFSSQRDGRTISLTFSAGVSELNRDSADLGELLSHADKALYHAKQTGRNKSTDFFQLAVAQ